MKKINLKHEKEQANVIAFEAVVHIQIHTHAHKQTCEKVGKSLAILKII